MTSKSKNGGDSGGRLCRKLLKCKYFATLKVNKSVSICFETYKLSVVSSEKDLGVWITSKSDFTMHCDKALRPCNLLG